MKCKVNNVEYDGRCEVNKVEYGGNGVDADKVELTEAYKAGYAAGVKDTMAKYTLGSDGRKKKALVGGYSGGRCPYGYAVNHGTLVIDEDEAPAVVEIFRRLEQGDSWQQIADALNLMRFPTRFGGAWTKSQIQSIKNNKRTYEGYYKYSDGDWVKGVQEPILR